SAAAKLAEFLLADSKIDEAREMAQKACDQLLPRNHVDASGALVTLALIRNDESSQPLIDKALRLVRESPLRQPGSMAATLTELQQRVSCLQPRAEHDNPYRQEDICLPQ